MQVIMENATINEEKSFTIHPDTPLVFNIRTYAYVTEGRNNRIV